MATDPDDPKAQPPAALPSHAEFLGPVLFALSVALQGMITLLFLYGPNPDAMPVDLTDRGRTYCLPERDIPLFAATSAVAVVAMLLCVYIWQRWVLGADQSIRQRLMTQSAGTLAFLGLGSFLFYTVMLAWRFVARNLPASTARVPGGKYDAYTIWLPALLAIVCAARELSDQRRVLNLPADVPNESRPWRWPIHLAIVLLIAFCVFIPRSLWPALSGSYFLPDKMHHWNYFAMGPALKWLHGRAFHVDFYSQYGMGWPITFVFLSRWLPLTYANMIGEGVCFATLYYCALYLLLVQFFGKPSWAAIGVLLCLMWQVYIEYDAGIWRTPSSSILRAPFDIFCFACLLLRQTRGKNIWLLLAGAIGGLALLFEVDAGMYLAITLVFYLGLCFITHRAGLKNGILLLLGFLATLLPGLFICSRGGLFHAEFWQRWFEGVYTQEVFGLGLLPIAGLKTDDLLFFIAQVAVYLLTLGVMLPRIFQRQASARGIIFACIAVYGMGSILLFVGRSHPLNLLHPTVPFAILLVAMLYSLREYFQTSFQMRLSSLAPALAVALCLFLVSSDEFRMYPSALKHLFHRHLNPSAGLCIFPDRKDLTNINDDPNSQGPFWAHDTQLACDTARSLASGGDTVVFLDSLDTTLYYGAGIEPWGRYPSLFTQIFTHQFLEQEERALIEQHPRYVFIRGGPVPNFAQELDVWQAMRDCVRQHYTLLRHAGTFEVYEWGVEK